MPRKSQPSAMAAATPLRQPQLEVNLPPLHPRQQEVFQHPSRFKVVVTGEAMEVAERAGWAKERGVAIEKVLRS